eukprot:CAMPEP_0181211018 /NCGR_PEP_ID=MMETSP1096-20121128/23556_1 /TAXON_ID=156174 ORGANISM="Chrysochromulina ericina, Strain CCMP281" /NCGR_SAMPLE_ID=MMETSP1096 /ASSEMBLY_ACC=CAM_ASM_000453 /LENGTH=130 /DNA_ID=CAMNT_0023302379 /DNA_START=510 /DNA_END=902 /DNA_ORIENTATION=-
MTGKVSRRASTRASSLVGRSKSTTLHLASLKEWMLTTTAGFEREAVDELKMGVDRAVLAGPFHYSAGRPAGFVSSAMPKKRQHTLDLQTQAPSGRSGYLRRISGGMNLYSPAPKRWLHLAVRLTSSCGGH